MSNIFKLYRNKHTVDLMRVDNVNFQNIRTDNTPMNRNNIKLHKGVDNEIRFRVFNQDRKPVSVDHLSVVAKLTSPQNGEQVLLRYLSISPQKGFMQLRILEGDLVNIAPGLYSLCILGEEPLVPGSDLENYRTPFYTDTGNSIVTTVEVVDSADKTPNPSFVIDEDDWRLIKQPSKITQLQNDVYEYQTSAVPGSRVRNHINALHTLALFTENFTGTIQVYATLELQPPEQLIHWFPVDLTSGTNYAEFFEYTGSMSFSFTANFMWLTFVKRPGFFFEDSAFVGRTVPLELGTVKKNYTKVTLYNKIEL